jgi:oxygen-independent coproporphyrinogen III oxidase
MRVLGHTVAPVAGWGIKREWVGYAFSELEKAGYSVGSAYTAVKDPSRTRFLYRDLLWTGADLIGLGVASFSHIGGTHLQNEHEFETYLAGLHQGTLPIYRALTPTQEQRMIRELILQMKMGHVHKRYFQSKFGVDIQQRFSDSLSKLQDQGFLAVNQESLRLNRDGLLQVDRLLYEFFLPEHRSARYV